MSSGGGKKETIRPTPSGQADEPICELLLVLAELPHYRLLVDRRCSLVVAGRTSVPFASAAEVERCFARIDVVLADVPRKMYRLLVDTRGGPLRNDPAFEAALADNRGKLLFGFAKNAALARTASGAMQIQRFARDDGRRVFTTAEPGLAFEYLGVRSHRL